MREWLLLMPRLKPLECSQVMPKIRVKTPEFFPVVNLIGNFVFEQVESKPNSGRGSSK